MWPLQLGYMDEALLFDNSPGGMQSNLELKRKGPCESFGEKVTSAALLGSGRVWVRTSTANLLNALLTCSSWISLASSLTSVSPIEPITSSPTIKDLRLEMRAGRTRSKGLKQALVTRSRSRSRIREGGGATESVQPALIPPPPVPLPEVPTGVGLG